MVDGRPVLRRKPLNKRNVGRKSKFKQQIAVEGIDPNLEKIDSFSKQFKRLTVDQRNQITRYLSDYISEEIGLGKKVKNVGAFTTPATAPDGQIELDTFNRLTGIKVSQTKVLKGSAAQNVGFFESKVKGLSTVGSSAGSDISLGAIDIARSSSGFEAVTGNIQAGKKGISGTEAYNLLNNTPSLQNEWSRVKAQITEKFENLLLINVIDAEKGGKRVQLNFVKNPLKNFDANKSSSYLEYFSLNIKPREKRIRDDKGNITERVLLSYRIESVPKASLRKQFEKRDITDKIIKSHSNAFSTGLRIYLERRIKQYEQANSRKASKEVISNLMGYAIALANEFKEGGQTPLSLVSKVQAPNMKIRPGSLAVVDKGKQKQQKFISGAQISALVRRRLGDKMPKGPRRGPPLAPDILTERSGRFRSSVQVIPNYRKSVMSFYYDPIYQVFNNTGRDPDVFVGQTIREVVQGLFNRNFLITRA